MELNNFKIFKNKLSENYIKKIDEAVNFSINSQRFQQDPTKTVLLTLGHIGEEINFDKFSSFFIDTSGKDILEFLNAKSLVILETFNSIRKVENVNRHMTGIHYDFQVSAAVHNSIDQKTCYTCWIPTSDVDETKPGLIVFDKDLTLEEIHEAAGKDGYIKNLDFITCSKNNKRFTDDPKYKKYIREEDEMHIVDLLADVKIAEKDYGKLKNEYSKSMNNIQNNLRGRYQITNMKKGDFLLFNSDCYHGTYLPENDFKPRINIDFRIISDFFVNDETDIFSGMKFSLNDDGILKTEPKNKN